MDTGKYSFVNMTIQHWNQLPAEELGVVSLEVWPTLLKSIEKRRRLTFRLFAGYFIRVEKLNAPTLLG